MLYDSYVASCCACKIIAARNFSNGIFLLIIHALLDDFMGLIVLPCCCCGTVIFGTVLFSWCMCCFLLKETPPCAVYWTLCSPIQRQILRVDPDQYFFLIVLCCVSIRSGTWVKRTCSLSFTCGILRVLLPTTEFPRTDTAVTPGNAVQKHKGTGTMLFAANTSLMSGLCALQPAIWARKPHRENEEQPTRSPPS